MFKEMRRSKQQLSEDETLQILQNSTSGVLALLDENGYPYTVPLSYVYDDGKIYFHSAKTGHKIDAIKNSNKASFCIIDKDEIISEKFTTYYKSVVAFGKVKLLEDEEDIISALEKLGLKYSYAHKHNISNEISGALAKTALIQLTIEHLSGKQALELTKNN